MRTSLIPALLGLAGMTSCLHANPFTVINTNAAGTGSLQQAILDADASPAAAVIAFNIPSGGLTIMPTNTLPALTNAITIDGSTQPGYTSVPLIQISGVAAGSAANGLVIGASNCVINALGITGFSGDNYSTGDAIQITNGTGSVVEGCYLGIATDGVTPAGNAGAGVRIGDPLYFYGPITSNNVVGGTTTAARNLISGNNTGIYVVDSMCNAIQGNFIGTDVTGTTGVGNTNYGVQIFDSYSTYNVVGGASASQRNLISGNGAAPYYYGDGVFLNGCQTNAVYGNYIGTDVTGRFPVLNYQHGVNIQYGNNNLVGGSAPGQGNLISGNGVNGVNFSAPEEDIVNYSGTPPPLPNGDIVQGNLIGTDLTGTNALPNQNDGVSISGVGGNLIGGFLPGEGNVISFNTNDGVEINGFTRADDNEVAGNMIWGNRDIGVGVAFGATSITILSNSIYGNTNLGIDLNEDGVTPNHTGYEFGANYDRNYPVLGYPVQYASQTVVSGTLNSSTNTSYEIELYDNDNLDPSGYGEGQRFLTALTVTTDGSGNASFTYTNPAALPLTDWISATATDTNGDTSEFSFARQVVAYDSVDIAVTINGAENPAPKSSPFVYTITVTNNGPADATDVMVTNPLPAGLTYVSATSSQGTCAFSSGTLVCNVGALATGAGAVITLTVNATTTTTITDTASAGADQSDNNLLNNSASVSTSFGIADMEAITSDSPDPIVAGQTITYTVIATNFGPDAASGASLSFSVDPSFFVTGASVSTGTVSPPGNYLNCSLGTLPVNGSATLTVTAIPTQVGTFDNNASVGANEYDPNPENNSTNQSTDVTVGPGVLEFSQAAYTVNENAGFATITVNRLGGTIGTVSVNFATSNLTAVAGTDYVATNGILVFPDSVVSESFNVAILDSGVTECNQYLQLSLSNPTAGAIALVQTNATLLIFNDHPEPIGAVQAISRADTNLISTGDGASQSPSVTDDGRYVAFGSYANNLVVTPAANGSSEIYLRDRLGGTNSLVSLDLTGTIVADNYSATPQISGDGQEVVFISSADNLTTNAEPGFTEIFARNLAAGSNVLVTVNTNGIGANYYEDVFTISTNGMGIAFRSYASDLAPNDNNNTYDVYYRNLASNSVVLVSENDSGTGSANGYSDFPHISADGNYVAFGSYASNLSPADNNTRLDIYRYNVAAATNELVSVNNSGAAGNSSCGSDIFISGDGRYVAFESYDSDLAPNANGSYQEIFLRDMTGGTNLLVSVNSNNVEAAGYCVLYGLSRDGRYVLFSSYANNLAANDTNNQTDLFLRDVVAGTTSLVTVNAAGTGPGSGSFGTAALSGTGRYVIFTSTSTNLVSNPKQPTVNDVFVRDMQAGVTTLLSTVFGGTSGGNADGLDLAISPGGVAAFGSYASDLANEDANGSEDIFARTPTESSPELVSQGSGVTGDNNTFAVQVAANGAKVAFASNAGNIVLNDTNGSSDVFLYDMAAHTNLLISANPASNGTQNGPSDSPAPSADGHYVAYHTGPVGTPFTGPGIDFFDSAYDQIYLRDSISNLTTLVSVNRTNTAPGNGGSINPQITPDGQYVVFESTATDLTSNDITSVNEQVFIRNRTNLVCELVSTSPGSILPGNGDSHSPSVSADGRFVAFETYASNLGPVDNNNNLDVYVRDRQTGSNILCSESLTGTNGGNNNSASPIVSADGSTVVFFSYASDLTPGGTSGNGNLFAFNIATRTLQLVSANTNGVGGNGYSSSPAVSSDGRYVAFASSSSDLTPNVNNQNGNVFVRDLVAGTTTLVSVNCQGTACGDNYSETPQISADGRYVTFHSYATDLEPGDFALDSGSIFRRDLEAGTTVLVSQSLTLLGEGNANSYNPTISGDGSVVAFLSSASDLIFGDINGVDDAFAWTTGVSGIDLAITLAPSANPVPQGSALSYTLTVTNYGLATATSVVVTDALPATLSYVSATTSLGTVSYTAGLFTCNLGTLNIGSGAAITINTTATTVGSVTNGANTSAIQSDFNPANNSASSIVTVFSTVRPTLLVGATNSTQLFFSWPYPSTGYTLQTTTNLAPAAPWLAVTNSVSNNGLLNFVILNINPAESTRFFRLFHP